MVSSKLATEEFKVCHKVRSNGLSLSSRGTCIASQKKFFFESASEYITQQNTDTPLHCKPANKGAESGLVP